MRALNHTLRASTMVETLVMMLVAGIVFLSVMDGLTLFTRLQIQRTGELFAAGRERDGYFRIVELLAAADSVRTDVGSLEIYQSDRSSTLELRDSALIYRAGYFRDTLLTRIARLDLVQNSLQPDTVLIGFGNGYIAKFPLLWPKRQYRITLDKIEDGYGYEE